jgi:flagellar biosynthetic protein FlhB
VAEKPGQERTESATPRRRAKAREEGNVARSMEIGSVVVLGVSLAGLAGLGPAMVEKAGGLLTWQFSQLAAVEITPATLVGHVHRVTAVMAAILLPFAGLIAVAGVGANVAQTGILVSLKALSPQFNRISPAQGVKKIFSKRGAVELAKSLVKMAIVAGVVGWAMAGTIDALLPLMTVGLANAYGLILGTMLKMAAAAAFALALVAILDLFFQRYDYEKQLMMTKQEVKEEHKETEGDPQIKSKIRSAQLAMSRRRMMEDVKTADVVVTNPIRFAVALKYEAGKSAAPRVVAKGARLLARRIRDIARESGVPIVENPPLARALYKACRVGAQIPLSMYQAVAELLAFVYRRRETAPGGLR